MPGDGSEVHSGPKVPLKEKILGARADPARFPNPI
jgi:hypothetical protein